MKKSNLGRLKFTCYGNPKTGKTRFAATFPKPLLIIGTEDGTSSIAGIDGVSFIHIESTDEFKEVINGPVKAGEYASVVLDTATKLRDLRLSEITGNRALLLQKKFGVAGRDQFMECAQNMKEMLGGLMDLPRIMQLNVIVIAQEADLNKETSGDSEFLRPTVGPALGKSISDFLCAESDYICQTLIREQTKEVKRKVGNQEHITLEKTGKKEYCIRIGPHEVYYTGFRISPNMGEVPDFVVNPTYTKLAEIIG